MRRTPLLLTIAATVTLVPAATASGAVVEGTSIGTAKLGMTKAQIRSARGATEQINGQNWSYPTGRVFFARGRAVLIATTDKRQATSRGIRNGSSKARVKRAYPTAVCVPEKKFRRLCAVDTRVGGRARQTIFYLSPSNRVNYVEVNSMPIDFR